VINERGFSFEEIRSLFLNKDGNKLVASNMVRLRKSIAKYGQWVPKSLRHVPHRDW
jgi:hypothetical protein